MIVATASRDATRATSGNDGREVREWRTEASNAKPVWDLLRKDPSEIETTIYLQQLHQHQLTSISRRPSSEQLRFAADSTVYTSGSMAANGLYNIYRLAIPVATGAVLINSALYDVKGGSRAVIFDRLSGVQEQVVNEGTHFLIPWLQKAIIYDVRTKPRNISTTTGSKDLQMVSLTLRVLHRPDVPKLPQIYQV